MLIPWTPAGFRRMVTKAALVCLLLPATPLFAQNALVKPDSAHLAWHDTEFYLFFHFGPNTFTNREWGDGAEPETVFNPSDLDCEQWCRIARQAGARGVVLTAKHHDGFCLWPSAYSTHTVRESPWRNGRGDVVRELADACRRNGLKFGVYLSPWDRNHPDYGTPAYNDVYANTLTELLTNYGPMFEIWWDGANGEGPNGRKQVYDFPRFERLVAQHQPEALIFSDIGPGCRWAGNESGIAGETNWCTLDTAGYGRGATAPPVDTLQQGNYDGKLWIPAECDVSIRPGWFYHPDEDSRVKSPEEIFSLYLKSVGRGANLILNVPPDRRGRIHERDSASLVAFGTLLQQRFAYNLAKDKPWVWVRRTCGLAPRRYLSRRNDGNPATYEAMNAWYAPWKEDTLLYQEVLDLRRKRRFDTVVLEEYLAEGQRVETFVLEVRRGKAWREVARGTTIGHKRIVRFPAVKARKLRISVPKCKDQPLLREVGVFHLAAH